MREIKFRAWSSQTKKYIDPMQNRTFTFSYYVSNENYVVEQYTGLKDKNGLEIYEGDRLQIDDPEDTSRCFVVFENGSFCRTYDKSFFIPIGENFEDWKIIGNIHEDKHS